MEEAGPSERAQKIAEFLGGEGAFVCFSGLTITISHMSKETQEILEQFADISK